MGSKPVPKILDCRPGQAVVITETELDPDGAVIGSGATVRVLVASVQGQRVRLKIEAPPSLTIVRVSRRKGDLDVTR